MILVTARAEVFKLVRRPAVWVTIGLLLALAVGIGYPITYLVATHAPANSGGTAADLAAIHTGLYPASFVRKALSNASTLDGIFALILGVLVQGSEYAWGTVKTAQTQLPGRLAIVAGQLVAIALILLVAVASIFLCDALASFLIARADGQSTTFPAALDIIKGLGALWLIFELLAVLGFGLATLFRQSAMAIGLGLAYVLVIESLVFSLLGGLGATFRQVHEWLPIANAGYLQQSFGDVGGIVGFVNSSATEPGATHILVALTLWTVGFAITAATLANLRDVV